MIRNVKHTNLNSKNVTSGLKTIYRNRAEKSTNVFTRGQSKHEKK